MSGRFFLLMIGLVSSVAGCIHVEQTGDEGEQPQKAATRVPADRAVTPKTQAGHPPLAASPDELMLPGSVEKISLALEAKGFLTTKEPTPTQFLDGLKAFQRSQGLAATGFADHETLMRLGISPKDVDKSLGTPDAKAAKANGPANPAQ